MQSMKTSTKKDELYEIFQTQLHEENSVHGTAQELIRGVAQMYTFNLMQKAHLPRHFFEDVLQDIESEVLEMYRKKTYGHVSLQDYRDQKSKKNK